MYKGDLLYLEAQVFIASHFTTWTILTENTFIHIENSMQKAENSAIVTGKNLLWIELFIG